MKLKDIIFEDESFDTDYTSGMENDIFDLLVAAKVNEISTINTNKFLKQLNSMGYELSPESLMGMIQDHPMVQNASETEITLKGEEVAADSTKNDANKNRDIVRNLAKKAVAKDIN